MPFRRRFIRRPRRKIFRRKRYLGKRKSGLKRLVKKIISRKQETKSYVGSYTGATNFAGQTNAAGIQANTFPLILPLSQGTGDGARIGDRVDVKSCFIKGCVVFNNSQSPLNSYYLRIIVHSSKDYMQTALGSIYSSIDAANFFHNGNSTATASGASLQDIFLPLNRHRINVYSDKTFIMHNNVTPASGTAGTYANCGGNGNPYHRFQYNVGKHFKRLLYDENGLNPSLPTNHNCWITFLYCPMNGATNDTVNYMHLESQITMSYKDA